MTYALHELELVTMRIAQFDRSVHVASNTHVRAPFGYYTDAMFTKTTRNAEI